MSAPRELLIRYENGNPIWVFLGSHNADALFAYLVEHLPATNPDYAEEFEYSNWGIFSVAWLPEDFFMAVYDMIMQACEELAVLKPHQTDLRQALESDPRFKQLQAA